MTTPQHTSGKFWHLQAGDGVRAVACLGIVAFHVATGALFVTGNLAGAGGSLTWRDAFGDEGRFGLRTATSGFYLFFVLSGFLVSAPFVAAFVEGRRRPRIAKYFRNRALRLLPAAWLMFAFVLVRHGTLGASFGELLAMFTFTDDHVDHPHASLVGQTWTLRVDLTFYAIVPLAAIVAMRLAGGRLGMEGRRRLVWAAAAAGTVFALVVASMVEASLGAARSPVALLSLFMPGVALAAALAGRDLSTPPRHYARRCAAISVVGVLLLLFGPRSAELELLLIVVGLGAGCALGGVILLEAYGLPAWRFFRARPVRWLGARTYGIYLWHLALMSELYFFFEGGEGYKWAYLGLLPLVIGASVVAAALSYRFVEMPAMRLRDTKLSSLRLPRPRARPRAAPHAGRAPAGQRLASVDAIRALAVVGVVVVHVATGAVFVTGNLIGAGGTTWPEEAFGDVGGALLQGLRASGFLLFALAGWLVGRPFVEAYVLGRERPSLRTFASSRALRLFPAAWLALAFLYLHHGTRGATTGEVLSSLTLTEAYAPHPLESLAGHLWMLKAGLVLIALLPVVVIAVAGLTPPEAGARARRAVVLALAAAFAAGSVAYAETVTPSLMAERSPAWVLSGFVVGVALAASFAGRRMEWRHPARARWIGAAVFAGGCALALACGQVDDVSPGLGTLLAALAAAALLGAPLGLEVTGAGASRLFDNRVMRWAGTRAYGLFLWHFLVMSELYPLFDGLESPWVALALLLPAVLVATGLVAELSWRLVERPALRLREWRREPAAVRRLGPEVAPVSGHAG